MPRHSRTTFWCRTFAQARQSDGWVLVSRLYTYATATQLASDITNSHRRTAATLRMRGTSPGERWEARWELAAGGACGDHQLWIRCTRPSSDISEVNVFSVLERV